MEMTAREREWFIKRLIKQFREERQAAKNG
jgi:hypothetical protein